MAISANHQLRKGGNPTPSPLSRVAPRPQRKRALLSRGQRTFFPENSNSRRAFKLIFPVRAQSEMELPEWEEYSYGNESRMLTRLSSRKLDLWN